MGDENGRAQEALRGGLQSLAQGVVKMFRSDGGRGWQENGGPAMLVYCANSSGVQWMKVVQLSDGAQLLDEEVYEDFSRTYGSYTRPQRISRVPIGGCLLALRPFWLNEGGRCRSPS